MPPPRCPMCEFEYAWETDRGCRHCGFPERGRANWAACKQIHTLAGMAAPIPARTWARFAAAAVRRLGHLFDHPPGRAALDWLDGRLDTPARPRELPPGGPGENTRCRRAVVHALLLVGTLTGGRADAERAALELAATLADADGWDRFPDRPFASYPLPPHLEEYREEMGALTPVGRYRLERDAPADPRAAACQALAAASYAYAQARANHIRAAVEAECGLLRDVVPYPFEPVGFDPAWRTAAVVGLARGMDVSNDFGPIPVLADALEDAGCADEAILAHCRTPGAHARGCWVVEHALGRTG